MAGADGTAGSAAAQNELRAQRCLNPTPFFRVQAEEWQTATADAFRDETSPAGEPWPPLAASTIEHRAAKLPGANRRTKSGALTKGARAKREHGRTGIGAIKMLVDTGHLKNATRYRADRDGIVVNTISYGPPHIDGDQHSIIAPRPPKRNFLVIERGDDGRMRLVEPYLTRFLTGYTAFIETGKVA